MAGISLPESLLGLLLSGKLRPCRSREELGEDTVDISGGFTGPEQS